MNNSSLFVIAYFSDNAKNRRYVFSLYIFLYQLVPRFISVFEQCSGQMNTVRDLLAIREEKAWKLYEDVIPTQDLAYLFCHDMLADSTIVAEDLNLCKKCGKKTTGHPPKTCSFVTKELNELFSSKRAEFLVSFKKHNLLSTNPRWEWELV